MADEVQRSKKQWGEKSAGGRRTDESLTRGSWTVRLTSAGDGCERRVRVCGVVSLGVGGWGGIGRLEITAFTWWYVAGKS